MAFPPRKKPEDDDAILRLLEAEGGSPVGPAAPEGPPPALGPTMAPAGPAVQAETSDDPIERALLQGGGEEGGPNPNDDELLEQARQMAEASFTEEERQQMKPEEYEAALDERTQFYFERLSQPQEPEPREPDDTEPTRPPRAKTDEVR